MAVRKIVALSDIHIGIDSRVNWYQSNVHEPYLLAALRYIYENASAIDEIILLGDLADMWTYLPSETPPSFAQVAGANPNVFGVPTGPQTKDSLPAVLGALDGKVVFVNGNHDMAVTQQDLDRIKDGKGNVIKRASGLHYSPPAGQGKVFCTHGHMYSVFCAPDPGGLENILPIGYLVTRLAAEWDLKRLEAHYPPRATVADMPNTGTPTGWSFSADNVEKILWGVILGDNALSELVMDIIIGDDTDKQKQQKFLIPDGSTPNAYELARTTYKDSYDGWVARAGKDPRLFGDLPGPFALKDVDFDDSLLHFAEVLGEQYRVVVMGHTHKPEDETDHPGWIRRTGKSLYVNCGFNCPSIPDMTRPNSPKRPTFVELVIDDVIQVCTVLVRYVTEEAGGGYVVAKDPLQMDQISLK